SYSSPHIPEEPLHSACRFHHTPSKRDTHTGFLRFLRFLYHRRRTQNSCCRSSPPLRPPADPDYPPVLRKTFLSSIGAVYLFSSFIKTAACHLFYLLFCDHFI